MRILLDNCVNHRFALYFQGREAVHVRDLGWAELSNGKLLNAGEGAGFNVLLTVDQSVRKQQNMGGRTINLITLDARSIILEHLLLFLGEIEITLRSLEQEGLIGQDILVTLPNRNNFERA